MICQNEAVVRLIIQEQNHMWLEKAMTHIIVIYHNSKAEKYNDICS